MTRTHGTVLACAVLVASVLAVYAQVATHELIGLDTGDYLLRNPVVESGLTWSGVRWAFTTFHAANWHPLTWLSLMLDVQVFGLHSGPLLLVNMAWHAADACLVYLVLQKMTGARASSLFVALLFALHPLHVESVAWIVERKDLLCAFFGLACLWFWTDWTRSPRWTSYAAALACCAAGLMSKPMLVTWPCVLLLFDVWPLARTGQGARRLLLEKLPFFALSAASCAITALAQGAAMQSLQRDPLPERIANAVTAYPTYLGRAIWPANLSFYYPLFTLEGATARVLACATLLLALSVVALILRHRAPWVLVGWLFFLGTLVPVIGLVQVGGQSMADRYTYLPMLGPFIAVAWTAEAWLGTRASRRPAVLAVAGSIAVLLGCAAWRQASTWKNVETLCAHALAVDPRNYFAHVLLAQAHLERNEFADAERECRAALSLQPEVQVARVLLGLVHYERGELDEAASDQRAALDMKPDDVEALTDLGNVLFRQGKSAEAGELFRRALRRMPDDANLHRNLALALWAQRRHTEALAELDESLRLMPQFTRAYLTRGQILSELDRDDEARAAVERALEIDPAYAGAHATMAVFYEKRGDLERARIEIDAAVAAAPTDADIKRQQARLRQSKSDREQRGQAETQH